MPKKIASEADWTELGLRFFAQGGPDALVVERLAKTIGSSKTSFYWYFKDRASYIDRIVDLWHERHTAAIIERQRKEGRDAKRSVKELLGVMFGSVQGGDFLFHLRRLGLSEPRYAARLEEVERQRLRHMEGLLKQCGFAEERARDAAELAYHYYLGWHERNKWGNVTPEPEETARQVELLLSWLGIDRKER